jgi:hypothetical protein
MGLDWLSESIERLRIVTANNCSDIANTRTLQCAQSAVFISRCLGTDPNCVLCFHVHVLTAQSRVTARPLKAH